MRLDLSARDLSPEAVVAIVEIARNAGKVERAYSGPNDAPPWPTAAETTEAVEGEDVPVGGAGYRGAGG